MYASGEKPEVGDIVRGSGGEGEVLVVIPSGIGGQENVSVQWSTVYEVTPGYRARKAPVQELTRVLTLVRRKTS
jgi:hypothetical protein